MSNIKACYTVGGIVVGEVYQLMEEPDAYRFKNPVVAIPRGDQMAIVPFLGLMEENTCTIKLSEMLYGGIFTPKVDLKNHYNQMFGSGIIEARPGAILGL